MKFSENLSNWTFFKDAALGRIQSGSCQKHQPDVFYEKGVIKKSAKFTKKHLCQSLFFKKVAGIETLAQVFPCEFGQFLSQFFSSDCKQPSAMNESSFIFL